MISYSVERLEAGFEEFKEAMMAAHWEECAEHKDSIPLDIDYEAFRQTEAAGLLLLITARDAGKLVGYWIGFVRRHLHYKTTITAHTDAFYIWPEYRARCGRGLFRFLHKELKARGVIRVFNRSKLEQVNQAGRFLEAIGYELVEYGYSYFLGKDNAHSLRSAEAA